ncbi:hypothetical protein Tco_0689734 [Tanacetum coccineum]
MDMGKDQFGFLGMTTGSSTWTIGGWTSLYYPLGRHRPLSPSVSTSTIGRWNLRGEFGCVLHGRKNRCLIWFANGVADGKLEIPWFKLAAAALRDYSGSVAGTWNLEKFCLSRSRALTISFNSSTSGDTPGRGSARTHFSNNGRCFGRTELGLALDDAEQSSGPFVQKVTPAAEFTETCDH